jgi:Secretion system C-terminal sorting domain
LPEFGVLRFPLFIPNFINKLGYSLTPANWVSQPTAMKRFYNGIASALFLFGFTTGFAQTIYVPTSITDTYAAGAQQWFSPGCCDPGHTIDNSGMTGAGLTAIHDACDNSLYFNKFAISYAYTYTQGWNASTVLPGYNINFSPGQTMNGIIVWNACFVMPLQGHYEFDANIRGFNMIITHGGGTATVNGQTFNNSLTDCAAQVKLFGATYNNVTQVRIVPTSAHANFSNPSTGGDRNIYFSEVRGILQAILSVDLKHFSANAQSESVDLVWVVSAENDCDYYRVERSLDGGLTWEYLNQVQSVGNGNDHTYSLKDYNPQMGWMAYKLIQVNKNGEQNELRASTTYFVGKEFITVFPVPVHDELTVKLLRNTNSPVTIKFFDLQGNLVFEKPEVDMGEGNLVIDMREFASGRYFVICSDYAGNVFKKAVLVD